VLGQAHPPRRRLLPFAAFASAVLIAPAVGGANPTQSVSSLRAHDAAIAAKSRAAVLDLYSLDHQLAAANGRLAALHQQAVSIRTERASLRARIAIAKRGTTIAQKELSARIRALYEEGNVEPIEILLGAKDLEEGMTNLDNLSNASSQGEDVLRQLQAAKRQLDAASRTLATRESALAAAVREARSTAASLAQARAARTSYVSSLASERNLTRSAISRLVAQAHAAEARAQTIAQQAPAGTESATTTSSTAPAPEMPSAAPAAGHAITVRATGYALGGTTATGLPVGWGIAAVDPSVIPLGTHMTVPGYGEAVAADTGGAVAGASIDLWFPTAAQANAWGRRTVTIVLH
jgi:3D (Asp-Asp-Asp) domain-containing protein